MTLNEAIDLIRPGITPTSGTWADIGAGTGLFTEALIEILESGKVIALDKSPHSLYEIGNKQSVIGKKISLEIVEADFHQPLHLPPLNGIIMANALHYAKDHTTVLKNVLTSLKTEGTFILIEYDTNTPNNPWVPNPVSFERFKVLCEKVGLQEPVTIGTKKSIYRDGEMYIAKTSKKHT